MALFCFIVYGQKVHIVKQNETLESIASLYHVTVEDLKKLNESSDVLFPGLLLNIPETVEDTSSQVAEQKIVPQLDKVGMKDGSYIICKVVSVRKATLLIKQDEVEGNISIPIKDVVEILYSNGSNKKFIRR